MLTKDNQGNANKALYDKLNQLATLLNNFVSKSSNAHENSSNNTNNNKTNNDASSHKNNFRAHPYGHSNGKSTRPYQGVCFGCNEKGHSFSNCRKISDLQKEEIAKNFETHLNKYRAERSKQTLNFSGVPPLPQ